MGMAATQEMVEKMAVSVMVAAMEGAGKAITGGAMEMLEGVVGVVAEVEHSEV